MEREKNKTTKREDGNYDIELPSGTTFVYDSPISRAHVNNKTDGEAMALLQTKAPQATSSKEVLKLAFAGADAMDVWPDAEKTFGRKGRQKVKAFADMTVDEKQTCISADIKKRITDEGFSKGKVLAYLEVNYKLTTDQAKAAFENKLSEVLEEAPAEAVAEAE